MFTFAGTSFRFSAKREPETMTVDWEFCAITAVLSVIATLQNRALINLLLNCCFMMNLLPSNYLANFPVSWVEQNFTIESSGVNWASLLVLGMLH